MEEEQTVSARLRFYEINTKLLGTIKRLIRDINSLIHTIKNQTPCTQSRLMLAFKLSLMNTFVDLSRTEKHCVMYETLLFVSSKSTDNLLN